MRYGQDFRKHAEDLAEFWRGPLYDNGVPVSYKITRIFPNKAIARILSENPEAGQKTKFTRDFWEGLIDSACTRVPENVYHRLEFTGRKHVRDFLVSEESGVPVRIAVTNTRPANYTRTGVLPFLHIPPMGNMADYFAGALAGSVPYRTKDGQLCCQMKKQVLEVLQKMGVIYYRFGNYVQVPVFYLMLFCGELPLSIYQMWLDEIPPYQSASELRESALISWMHWRFLFEKKKQPVYNGLPFLLSSAHFRNRYGIQVRDVKALIAEKHVIYVDKRIQKRCKRWYNMNNVLREKRSKKNRAERA